MSTAIERVRRFNRFYTQQIGVLTDHLLSSPFSLTEVRVMYEIANRKQATAAFIANDLRLDRGYLSRILRRFQKQGLIRRTTSADDARRSLLSLTPKGERTFGALNARQNDEVAALLKTVPPATHERLTDAMTAIEQILAPQRDSNAFLIREPRSGDLGWIVHRHGVLYWEEYRYDMRFEALVAKIVGEFIEHYDAQHERCWVAEKDGAVVGSIFLVRKSKTVSKLRLLYVEPSARGLGIGQRLIAECVQFARAAGYKKIILWTQSELLAARHLYEKAGFVRVSEEAHQSFSRDDLVAEVWELNLI